MSDFGAAHDRYLAAYRTYPIEVWCTNKKCEQHEAPQTVRFETEYGQGWLTPDECPLCGSEWSQDAPEETDDG